MKKSGIVKPSLVVAAAIVFALALGGIGFAVTSNQPGADDEAPATPAKTQTEAKQTAAKPESQTHFVSYKVSAASTDDTTATLRVVGTEEEGAAVDREIPVAINAEGFTPLEDVKPGVYALSFDNVPACNHSDMSFKIPAAQTVELTDEKDVEVSFTFEAVSAQEAEEANDEIKAANAEAVARATASQETPSSSAESVSGGSAVVGGGSGSGSSPSASSSGSGSSGSPSSSGSVPSSSPKPERVWVDEYSDVWVEDSPAWTEEQYEDIYHWYCCQCGYEGTEDQVMAHCLADRKNHWSGNYWIESIVIGTTQHPATGHYERQITGGHWE